MLYLTQPHLEDYLRSLTANAKSPTTIEGYRYDLTALVTRQIRLDAEGLAAFITRRPGGQPYAQRTRNRRLAAVRGLIRHLISRGLLTADPTAGLTQLSPHRTIRLALGEENLQRVLTVLRQEPTSWRRTRNEALLKLLYYTGLRLTELHRLDVSQVDLANGLLHGVERKGWVEADAPVALLNNEAIKTLERWLAVRPQVASPALFISQGGGRLSRRMIQKLLLALGEQTRLPIPLTPHTLRHEFNEAMRRQGTPLDIRQLLMAHQSPETTRLYDHPNLAELRGYLNRIPKLEPSGEARP